MVNSWLGCHAVLRPWSRNSHGLSDSRVIDEGLE
jgi:hypothetical protein